MNGELAVLSILLGASGVTAIVEQKIFLDEAPQGESLPYVIVELTDQQSYPTKSGKSGADDAFVNVFSYASTAKQRRELSDACRNALDDVSGTANGVNVVYCFFQNASGFTEQIKNEKVFVKDQEYKLRIKL